ncbi:hypothetical protein PR048_006692 [Dryococelus australis]|uniref:Uncharacterized protein n=1 Tax=Dryococelus australis TaxID=614101 RepID=A0ABQ9ICA7_9NEOP|nr:hypothetical protein PR048_006692 [Dryococelus australis]
MAGALASLQILLRRRRLRKISLSIFDRRGTTTGTGTRICGTPVGMPYVGHAGEVMAPKAESRANCGVATSSLDYLINGRTVPRTPGQGVCKPVSSRHRATEDVSQSAARTPGSSHDGGASCVVEISFSGRVCLRDQNSMEQRRYAIRGGGCKTLRRPADQWHRPVRFPHATLPGIVPGSSRWEASSLTTAALRPLAVTSTRDGATLYAGTVDNEDAYASVSILGDTKRLPLQLCFYRLFTAHHTCTVLPSARPEQSWPAGKSSGLLAFGNSLFRRPASELAGRTDYSHDTEQCNDIPRLIGRLNCVCVGSARDRPICDSSACQADREAELYVHGGPYRLLLPYWMKTTSTP